MKLFFELIGIILVVGGFLVFWLPIPLGLVMIGVGAAILVAKSNQFRAWLHHLRQRWDGLDRLLSKAEVHLPYQLSRPLKATDAGSDSDRDS